MSRRLLKTARSLRFWKDLVLGPSDGDSRSAATSLKLSDSFVLSGLQLSVVKHYRYLGIIFQADLTWKLQTENVLTRIRDTVGTINRVIARTALTRTARVPTIRSLVLALVFSRLMYGLPYWHPSDEATQRKFQSAYVRPFASALCLPANTHITSILVECGVPDFTALLHAATMHQVRLICKVRPIPDHPSISIWRRHVRAPVHQQGPLYPFYRQAKAAFKWNVVRFGNQHIGTSVIWQAALQSSFDRWKAEEKQWCQTLRDLKHRPGLAEYLRSDSRLIAAMRARCRLNRPRLNHSMSRRQAAASDLCDHCNEPETTEHFFKYCGLPNLRKVRSRFPIASSLPIRRILGDVTDIEGSDKWKTILQTAKYIDQLAKVRFV